MGTPDGPGAQFRTTSPSRRRPLSQMSKPPTDHILFRCHACRQKYAVEPARIGTRTHCQKCQVVMQVPRESALDNPEASKPTLHVMAAKATPQSDHESVAELSFDDVDPQADESLVVDEPAASAIRNARTDDAPSGIVPPPPDAGQRQDLFNAPPVAADSGIDDSGVESPKQSEAKAPPGKKLCPNCQHACPSMAMSCPLCQHRFELPKPKPKPAPAAAADSGVKIVEKPGASLTLKPSGKDLGKKLDNAITERKKKEGRPVEPPMWMDELVYGSAFKMGFAGLCCLGAGIIVFIQLDSPESARHAFFLIKWIYKGFSLGGHTVGRLAPSLVCLASGAAFLYCAIKPVVEHLKREKAIQLTDLMAKESPKAPLADE